MLTNLLNSSRAISAAALTATALLSFTSQAQAVNFTGTTTGQFGLPTKPSESTILSNENGGINNRLTWGIPNPGSFTNYVQFDGVAFTAPLDTNFEIGQLTYRNGSVTNVFNGDFPLQVALNLTNPFNSTQSFSFLFNILNTPNSSGNPVIDGDRLRFSTSNLATQYFNYNGEKYTLQLTGFSADGTIVDEFNSPEGATAKASLFAKLTVARSVPEPASIAGVSLLGMYFVARRNRRNSLTVTKSK